MKMSCKDRKVLIFGIDGGTWTVLQPALDGGYMPYLKGLIDSGGSGILESTIPAITPAAWGSFQTGVGCGKTGVFDFAYWDKCSCEVRYVSSETLPATIWEMASAEGKRVGIINVPMTYPPRKINGCMVTGILTPSMESDFTYPPQLKEQLLESIPTYHIFNLQNASEGSPHGDFEGFVRQMIKIAGNRAEAAQFILEKQIFDLFMVHFQTTDIIQHVMWGYMDQGHSMYDPVKRDYIFKNFYKFIDEKIKQIHENFRRQAGHDFLTLIVSDHGQQAHKKRINIGNLLYDEGLLHINVIQKKRTLLKKMTSTLGIGKLFRIFVSEESVKKLEKAAGLTFQQINWHSSKAFSFGRSGEGFIYLLSEDDQEKKDTRDHLISIIEGLRDTETGEMVVKNIFCKEDIYSGPFMDRMPDLIVEPVSGYSFTGAPQKGEGLFSNVEPGTDFHMGKHHKNGIIVANGRAVELSHDVKLRLIDIVPTILYYLHLPTQENMDGTIAYELFNDEFKRNNNISMSKQYKCTKDGKKNNYSRSEESEIEQRLKDLGYF